MKMQQTKQHKSTTQRNPSNTAPEASTSAVAGELVAATDRNSSMPSNDMQPFMDQQ